MAVRTVVMSARAVVGIGTVWASAAIRAGAVFRDNPVFHGRSALGTGDGRIWRPPGYGVELRGERNATPVWLVCVGIPAASCGAARDRGGVHPAAGLRYTRSPPRASADVVHAVPMAADAGGGAHPCGRVGPDVI